MTIDSYTKSLLHFTGTDGSNSFLDASGKAWTANGNAQIDTAQYRFFPSSGLFDGVGDWIDTPDSADFDFGLSDFTIDFWILRNRESYSFENICGQESSANAEVNARISFLKGDAPYPNSLNFTFGDYDYFSSTVPWTVSDGWNHAAIVRSGTNFYIFKNGIMCGSYTKTISLASSKKLAIGRSGEYAGSYFQGWIDEFRISKGIARWTSNFPVPVRDYENVFVPSIMIMPGEF